jgi:hypothetical protein
MDPLANQSTIYPVRVVSGSLFDFFALAVNFKVLDVTTYQSPGQRALGPKTRDFTKIFSKDSSAARHRSLR